MEWIVDAIEKTPDGNWARLEIKEGEVIDIPLYALPIGIKEGDRVIITIQPSLRTERLQEYNHHDSINLDQEAEN